MKYAPSWKVRREVRRLFRQAAELPAESARRIYFRRYYDWVLRRKITTSQGQIPVGDEVCIYAIFPVDGVLDSHISVLNALTWSGISTVVVSNGALSPSDRELLLRRSSIVIERPNIGYDFGAYREGILTLSNVLNELTGLWLINDSVWYIAQDPSWFEMARACDADLVSATCALPRGEIQRWDEPESYWRYSKGARNFHYASYALNFRPTAFMRSDFLDFWKRMDIRNDKSRTVRRGEIGLTRFLKRAGLKGECTYSYDSLDAELEELGYDDLLDVAKNIVILDDPNLQKLKEDVLARSTVGARKRKELTSLVLFAAARQNPAYSLARYAIERRGGSFLKKSPVAAGGSSATIVREIMLQLPKGQAQSLLGEWFLLAKPRRD